MAKELGFIYLDTGAMYRAATRAFLDEQIPVNERAAEAFLKRLTLRVEAEEDGLRLWIDDADVTDSIRDEVVSRNVSAVSALAPVREKMVEAQRAFARKERGSSGIVVDGRDIGTVVFPDAEVKVFLVAEARTRARRRHAELMERGAGHSLDEVLDSIVKRDRLDTQRAHSPLRKAEDAVELDTTSLTVREQVDRVVALVRERSGTSSV